MSQLTPRPDLEAGPHDLEPPPVYRDYEPIQPERPLSDLARRLWAPIAAAGAFLAKFGAVLFKLKFFTVAISMIVSIGAYALLGGWWFGLGLVVLIFVHEIGHVLELRRQGVPASAPLFIPFLGAVVGMKQMPKNAWKEAQVALAGPILGSIGALVVYGAAVALDSNFLKALAFIGFFINLFNLIPVVPLDGGRAVAALHPGIWLAGLVGLVALAFMSHNPFLYFIVLLGGKELYGRWRGRGRAKLDGYYSIERWQRVTVAVVYIALAALLVVGMTATHVPRNF